MEHDEPTEWPPDGYADGNDRWLADPEDAGLPDPDLDYDTPGHDTDGFGDEAEPGDDPDDGHITGGGEPDEIGDGAGPELADDARLPTLDRDLQDPVPGTDPDLNPFADDESATADPFPRALDFAQPPEPVDGMPWTDPDLLGDDDTVPLPDPTAGYEESPPVTDLYTYDGMEPSPDDSDPWASLADSEDPATSSLARFWAPGDRMR
jgi:hypothetical protein